MKVLVGAYAAFPSTQPEVFLDGLRTIPEIGGLEIPFTTPEGLDHLSLLKPTDPWTNVLNPIGGVMNRLKTDSLFGLASADAHGRDRALDFYRQAHAAVLETNQRLGRRAFSMVALHSAPQLGKGATSSTESMLRSLDALRELDWQGAELAIEHCDAFVPNQNPAKGFMPFDREIDAIQGSSGRTPCGILINWGRSAIEGRSAQTALQHIHKAKQASLLRGLIFSGACTRNELYGEWADSHAPFDAENSVLTLDSARAAVQATGGTATLRAYGFKMQALPQSLSTDDRIAFIRKNLLTTQQAANVLN